MSHTEALALIHAEALGESGLVVAARMGYDLDPTRVARLVFAIRTVADSLRGAGSLDRELAASLHVLGFAVLREAENWASRSQELPKVVLDSLINLEGAVEDIFSIFPDDTMMQYQCAAANAAIALWLQFTRPAGRVAEFSRYGTTAP